MADVKYFVGGGGARTFTGFNAANQTFEFQAFDQTLLKRTGTNSYELLWPDGSKQIFAQSDGSIGSTRNLYLTQLLDASSNAVTLTYTTNATGVMQLTAITDAIGQVTTLTYGIPATHYTNFDMPADPNKLTKVIDPFGRFATFDYAPTIIDWHYTATAGCPTPGIAAQPIRVWWLDSVTDVLGLASQFHYLDTNILVACATCPTNGTTTCATNNYSVPFIDALLTPYGTTTFISGEGAVTNGGNMRFAEVHYPDGSRERVEFNQADLIDSSDPAATVPKGMNISNEGLQVRNTYYWDRNACATAYGEYHKARIYHWMHANIAGFVGGVLESIKAPLENRVWFAHPGGFPVGPRAESTQIGRVLDDGSTQLYTYGYNRFGLVTNMIDPVGRAASYVYDTNGVDLLEVRQTRGNNNELVSRRTYNTQHHVLTATDPAGQTTALTYNARGQILTASNAKGETVTFAYDTNSYLIAIDGPLPGTNDTATATYDAFGRARTLTDVSGYTVTFDYDTMNRITRVTCPDGTFSQYAYDRLGLASIRDRAGRTNSFEHDSLRQLRKATDPLGRVTLFDWCRCGALKGLTDPMGRKTTWVTDVQDRPIAKHYPDGSQVQYFYENTTSRLRQIIDENQQITEWNYNTDDTLRSIAFANCTVPTPAVTYEYDPNYQRVTSMTDGTGTTLYSYIPVTDLPSLGAGRLAMVDGPLPDDTVTYSYDELGRPIRRSINGEDVTLSFDSAGRLVGVTNALGIFGYAYDGSSGRLVSRMLPNGQVEERSYNGNLSDRSLQRISHRFGTTPISEFIYRTDVLAHRITNWSQQAGPQIPLLFTFGYDAVNQLLSATVTNAGALVEQFAYSYDAAGNRLAELAGATNYASTYNALNEISTTTAPAGSRTNEWDALNRLIVVERRNRRTEFAYDGLSRLASIRLLTNGVEASLRRFVWCGNHICEERDAAGAVTKRFFASGVKIESGPNAGAYYYTRDHLGSIRELVDTSGNIRARYAYEPYGRRARVVANVESDFGFAGMLWSSEADLALTHYRAYDPELGRWLSRDPLGNAETREGPNLYAYVRNEPVSRIDPQGLCGSSLCACFKDPMIMAVCVKSGLLIAEHAGEIEGEATTLVESLPAGECLAQTLPEAPTFVENAPTIIPELQVVQQTLPGIGPDTITMTENIAPNAPIGETVPSIAPELEPELETALEELTPFDNWWVQTVKATADWRTGLPLEQQIEAMRGTLNAARIVFNLPLIW
jgi:RHS repeat-associated protein